MKRNPGTSVTATIWREALPSLLPDLCSHPFAGPSKLRIEQDNIQIAEVKDDKFMEYVDVEGLIQPILTIKVNTVKREA